jgi:hypothetical protein
VPRSCGGDGLFAQRAEEKAIFLPILFDAHGEDGQDEPRFAREATVDGPHAPDLPADVDRLLEEQEEIDIAPSVASPRA